MTDCSCEEKCKNVETEKTLNVLGKHIVIKRDEAENEERKSPGGIVLVSQKPDPHTATVIGVGADIEAVKKGDKVIVGRFAGTMFNFEEDELCAVSVEDIIAIV